MKDAFVGLNLNSLMEILSPADKKAIKVHLSQAAVQEFYKRNVKPIYSQDVIPNIKKEARDAMKEALREAGFTEKQGWSAPVWGLPQDMTDEIKNRTKSLASDLARKAYAENVPAIEEQLTTSLNSLLDSPRFSNLLEHVVKAKIESLVNDQIKAWLPASKGEEK